MIEEKREEIIQAQKGLRALSEEELAELAERQRKAIQGLRALTEIEIIQAQNSRNNFLNKRNTTGNPLKPS